MSALTFLGQTLATPADLRAAFPAFGGDGPLAAIRAGCTTPLEVEAYCWRKLNVARARTTASVRARHAAQKERVISARRAAREGRA